MVQNSAKQAAKALHKKVSANEISDLGPRSAMRERKKERSEELIGENEYGNLGFKNGANEKGFYRERGNE